MLDWLESNKALFWWLGIGSLLSIPIAIVVLPFVVARLPTDYFVHRKRKRGDQQRGPLSWTLWVGRQVIGVALLVAGVVMLALPGQGVLAILIGLTLVDFPGKFRLERWLVRRGPTLRMLNWLRAKRDAPPLEPPGDGDGGSGEGDAGGDQAGREPRPRKVSGE